MISHKLSLHVLKCKKKLLETFIPYVATCVYRGLMFLCLQDPKRHLEEHVDVLMTTNIVQCLGAMLHTVVFK